MLGAWGGMDALKDILATLQAEGYQFAVLLQPPHVQGLCNERFEEQIVSDNIPSRLRSRVERLANMSNTLVCANPRARVCSHGQTGWNPRRVELDISNRIAVGRYLNAAFRLLRQLPCKQISKSWIKVIEPKKKARYPYMMGEQSKPNWWPQDVEHREPDHLQKPDRLALMTAIMLNVAPLCYRENRLIYKNMQDATHALFKGDREGFLKELILENVYQVSHAIAMSSHGSERPLQVLDLNKIKSVRQYMDSMHSWASPDCQSLPRGDGLSAALFTADCPDDTPVIEAPDGEETDLESFLDSESTACTQIKPDLYAVADENELLMHMHHQVHANATGAKFGDGAEADMENSTPSTAHNHTLMLL
ncbi:AGR060Wp [Eremothecium gossypii ATCC 10895]|uniref:AGR060Wp n=1 Tax=Eremothecium gossypii (strain ATCC 10895 / CBS 109.51 / FGSC 9923 / NRRL Y-1056) TaxID=284811 RepID=Q74ZZ7_EREGS|nr:AGR060Wp [Eremothecium gossypii ATCC 10895]AAS54549.2 AGR060Wp [Eremothecium gossypii ATCC 10895]AEY98881.1 FAGR060Wp [Eremothecium gossypii FDAG1]